MEPITIAVIVAGVIAAISVIVSIFTCFKYKNQQENHESDHSVVHIENFVEKKKGVNGEMTVTKKQIINIDKDALAENSQLTQIFKTIPNETATQVGTGAVRAITGMLAPSGGTGETVVNAISQRVVSSPREEERKAPLPIQQREMRLVEIDLEAGEGRVARTDEVVIDMEEVVRPASASDTEAPRKNSDRMIIAEEVIEDDAKPTIANNAAKPQTSKAAIILAIDSSDSSSKDGGYVAEAVVSEDEPNHNAIPGDILDSAEDNV